MSHKKILASETARAHFTRRARKYNHSSNWVDDIVLIGKMWDWAEAGPEARVLDIAIGTGKVAQTFYGQVKYVVGVDICKEMTLQARGCADQIILTLAEKLPFKNDVFDVCVCRQGLQFMDIDDVLSQIHRVLKPGGRVVLAHLTAYGEEDKDETFLIQKLRNPSRKNFFIANDFLRLLDGRGFSSVESSEHLTKESVDRWIDNGAISENARASIRRIYENASADFKRRHNIQFEGGDIFDTMKMFLVRAIKEQETNLKVF